MIFYFVFDWSLICNMNYSDQNIRMISIINVYYALPLLSGIAKNM